MPEEQLPLPETDPITVPSPNPDTGPEVSEDYDRIFGTSGGDHPVADDMTSEEISFDPSEAIGQVEPGKYLAVVCEPPKKQISQNGNPMMAVTFQITEGPFIGSLQWRRYMLSGRAGGWTVEFLKAIGLEDEAAGKKPINPTDVEGRRLEIHVRVQKDNPEFLEVWKVKRHPDGPVEIV